MSDINNELEAMQQIWNILIKFNLPAQIRIIDWLTSSVREVANSYQSEALSKVEGE